MYRMICTIHRYDRIQYDTHLCIGRFMSTNDTALQYETFCTQYDTYHTIRIAYRTILTTMITITV